MALDTYWMIVALTVGAAAVCTAVLARRGRREFGGLLIAGAAVSGAGWLTSAAIMLAGRAGTRSAGALGRAPGGTDSSAPAGAVTLAAAVTVAVSVSLLLVAVERLPGAATSAAARLRRSVDSLQVSLALLLVSWIVAGLVFADEVKLTGIRSPARIATAIALVAVATTTGFTVVAVRQAPRPRGLVVVLMSGILAVTVGNTATIAAVERRTPAAVIVAGALSVAGLLAIGYTASSRRGLAGPAVDNSPTRWGLQVVAVSIALVMAIVYLIAGGKSDAVSVVLGVLTGFALMTRQALALADARRYLGRLRDEEELLRKLAYTDPLTGVGNRRHLMATLTDERIRQGCVLVALDLDGFTDINDLRGHTAGDEVLAAVGARLRTSLRPGDIAARIGGDEFAVLLLGSESDAPAVAQRLLAALAAPVDTSAGTVFVTASIGHAACQTASDIQTLLRNADVALRLAKQKGNGSVQRYDVVYDEFIARRTVIEQGLRGALAAGEFTLAYQPIVELPGGRPVAVEALLRWDSASLGRVAPDEFIPIAEDAGLIASIDRWVMHEACRQLGRWLDDGRDLWLSVNVSVRELHCPEYVDQVAEILRIHHVQPGSLVIEVTEHSAALDLESLVDRLSALRDAGVRIALDDFGAGYSSLGQLRQVPVDILKIDRSLVGDPSAGGRSRAVAPLVDVVVQLGERLGLAVIAEGVADAAARRVVEGAGCLLGQGDLFGPAASAERIEAMLAAEATPRVVPRPRYGTT